jgi:hypothetical protein
MRNWRWSSLNANAGLKANAILKADASLLHDGFVMQVEHPCARLRDPATTKTGRGRPDRACHRSAYNQRHVRPRLDAHASRETGLMFPIVLRAFNKRMLNRGWLNTRARAWGPTWRGQRRRLRRGCLSDHFPFAQRQAVN